MKIKMLILILPSFFNCSFFLLSLLFNTCGHFSVKNFSATTWLRILKFTTKLDSDELHCVVVSFLFNTVGNCSSIFSETSWAWIFLTILSFLWKWYNLWWLPIWVCELCSLLALLITKLCEFDQKITQLLTVHQPIALHGKVTDGNSHTTSRRS